MKQFGARIEGRDYKPRQGAYGILWRDGLIACAQIGYSDFEYDLPGGGIDPGETPEQAVVREFGEETGLEVRVKAPVTELMHYFISDSGTAYNNHCHFFEVELTRELRELKVEPDHELVWLNPLQTLVCLKNEGFAWALTLWLRARKPSF